MQGTKLTDSRILIVDDDSTTVELIKAFLRDEGFFNIFFASDGKSALAKIRQRRIDLMLCDWNMPEMNGLQLVKEIRADSRFKSMKILMITGTSEREKVKEAMQSGVQGYIVKPFQLPMIREKINALLS